MTTFPNTNILINTQRSRFIIKVTITKNVLSQKEHPARLQENKIDSMKYILIKFGGNNVFFLNGIYYCVLTLKKKNSTFLAWEVCPSRGKGPLEYAFDVQPNQSRAILPQSVPCTPRANILPP